MEFTFIGECHLTLEYKKGDEVSSHVSTDFNLDVSEGVDKSAYLGADGLPTQEGSKVLTKVFIQGLVGNIHAAHQMKHWDSAEHLRYIISELERGFIQIANAKVSTFKTTR